MNRADLSLVLNQIDGVGDTLLRNRMNAEAKQERAADRNLRERMFTEQQATRKELQTQNNAWKTQNEDQQQLQMIIKANADGSLDDASRERANQWIMQHPQLSATGIQLTKPMPKAVGTLETSQTRNHAELKKLQEQIRLATTPEAKAQAEQDLADFKSLLPGKKDTEEDFETVTEVFPEQKEVKKSVVTTTPGDKRYGVFGIDALAKDAPPIKSTNTVVTPAIPERRISYKRPRGSDTPAPTVPTVPAAQATSNSFAVELKLAQDAIRQGANRAKVAAKFKARTGQDLPQ